MAHFVPLLALLASLLLTLCPAPVCSAETLADALALALRAAEKLPAERKQGAYARIAVVQANAGRHAEARKTLELAVSHPTERLQDGFVSEYPAKQTALALALTGKVDEALDAARGITHRYPRAVAIAQIAASLGGAESSSRRSMLFGEAVEHAANAAGGQEGDLRLTALIQVAAVQHRARFTTEAGATLAQAVELVESRSDRNRRADDHSTIASVQAEFGLKDAANQTFVKAREAGAETTDSFVRSNLVSAAIAVGQLDEAVELLRSIRATSPGLIARSRVGVALGQAGRRDTAAALFDQALAAYTRQPAGEQQTQDLAHLARLARASGREAPLLGLLGEVLTRARSLPVPLRRTDALSGIGRAYCEIGRHDAAVKVLGEAMKAEAEIDWSRIQGSRALPDPSGILIDCLVSQRQTATAMSLVSNIQQREKRPEAFASLARALVRVGDLARALTAAGKVDDPESRLNASLEIADAPVRR